MLDLTSCVHGEPRGKHEHNGSPCLSDRNESSPGKAFPHVVGHSHYAKAAALRDAALVGTRLAQAGSDAMAAEVQCFKDHEESTECNGGVCGELDPWRVAWHHEEVCDTESEEEPVVEHDSWNTDPGYGLFGVDVNEVGLDDAPEVVQKRDKRANLLVYLPGLFNSVDLLAAEVEQQD